MAQKQQSEERETRPRATEESVQHTEPAQMAKPVERAVRPGIGRSEVARRSSDLPSRFDVGSPFSVMRRFMDEIDRMFSGFGLGVPSAMRPPSVFEPALEAVDRFGGDLWSPAIETFERDGRLVFRADLPGLGRDDVKVEIVGDELVVSGERKHEAHERRGGRLYSERRYGIFERRITLPEGVDPEGVEAHFENGVLDISIALPEPAGPHTRTIEIKSAPASKSEEGGTDPVH